MINGVFEIINIVNYFTTFCATLAGDLLVTIVQEEGRLTCCLASGTNPKSFGPCTLRSWIHYEGRSWRYLASGIRPKTFKMNVAAVGGRPLFVSIVVEGVVL